MNRLKLVYHNNGKHRSDSFRVSMKDSLGGYLSDIYSPSDIVGVGNNYEEAQADFSQNLDDYINALIKFRETLMNKKETQIEVIEVDCLGRPVNVKEYK